jgi:hypothetical protein
VRLGRALLGGAVIGRAIGLVCGIVGTALLVVGACIAYGKFVALLMR